MQINKEFKNLVKLESKDAATYTLVTFITGLGSFLIVPLFWSKLTPVDYGIIAITEVVGGFFGGILGLSLDQSQTRFYYEWPEEERKIRTGTLWLVSWGSTVLMGALITLLLWPTSRFLFPDIGFYPYVFLGLILTVIGSLSAFVFATIRIMKIVKVYVIFRLGSFFLTMGCNILLVIVFNKGVLGYFYGSIISGIIALIFLTFLMINRTKIKINLAHLRDPLKFSLPLIPSTLIENITAQTDRFLLQHYVSLNVLGVYSVSLKFASLVSQLHQALKLSYGPFLYKTIGQHKEAGNLIVSKMTSFYVFPLFLMAFSVSLFIDNYVIWTGQKSYFGIIDVVPFLCLISLISCFYVYMAPGIVLSKKTKLLIIPTTSQLVALIGVGLFLLPHFHIFGLIMTKFLAVSIFFTVSLILSNKVYDWKPQYRTVFLFLFTLIFLLALRKVLPNGNVLQNTSIDILFLAGYALFGIIILKKSTQMNSIGHPAA